MESKSFVLKSKIYIPPKSSITKRVKFFKIGIIILIIITLLSFLTKSVNRNNITVLIALVFVYTKWQSHPEGKGGLQFIPVEINLSEQGIEMVYRKFDKRDNMGIRDEKVFFSYKNIWNIEYIKKEGYVRFYGKPIITTDFEDKSKFKDTKIETDGTIEKEHILYVSADEADKFIEDFVSFSNIVISYRD